MDLHPGRFEQRGRTNRWATTRGRAAGVVGATAATMLFCLATGQQPAQAAPADPFTGAAPAFEEPPSDTVNLNVGDWGVAEQRGTSTYTITVPVPPGRNAMAPELRLRYTSDAGLRGGIAVGWRLDLPSITLSRATGVGPTVQYQAALGGHSGTLVPVPDTAVTDTNRTGCRQTTPSSASPGPARSTGSAGKPRPATAPPSCSATC